jgi:hypothetical protein
VPLPCFWELATNVIIQIERRPGSRYFAEVLELRGYDPETDNYDLGTLCLHKSGGYWGLSDAARSSPSAVSFHR